MTAYSYNVPSNPVGEGGKDHLIYTVEELSDTTATAARGSSGGTTYLNEPRLWLKQLVNAAKKEFKYLQATYQTTVPKGNKDVVIPKASQYITSYESSVTPGTAVNFTTLDNIDGVAITPSYYNYGFAITNDVIQTNNVDHIARASEELTYHAGDVVDQAVVTAFVGATAATSSASGAYTIYGGDATQASELEPGDTITTDMVAEARKKLMTNTVYYWTLGTGESKAAHSTATANPWKDQKDFQLFVSPEQQEVFETDSQFVNASEYGGREILMNGEIGRYLGVKIITSTNTKIYSANAANRDGTTNSSIDTNTCIMTKPRKGAGFAYGQKPRLHVFPYPSQLETRLILEQSYGTGVIHDDAIVFLDVAQV